MGSVTRRAMGLACKHSAALLLSLAAVSASAQADYGDVDREVFQLGLFTGVINVGDFGSEFGLGLSASLQASERFFLQYNYLQAEVDPSSFERSQGRYFSDEERDFVHYDLLLGYKLFHGEFYPEPGAANLSSFYVVGGIGETQFGGEENFSFTGGLGYQLALTRDVVVRADYRVYVYDSALIRDEERTTESSQFSVGIDYLF